jgi:hypothetical protein
MKSKDKEQTLKFFIVLIETFTPNNVNILPRKPMME